jgi:hypothetical protein
MGFLLTPGCASTPARIDGISGAVVWRATDLELDNRSYRFSLLLTETQDVGITFTEIKATIYQPGTNSWIGTFNGTWRLDPKGQMRIPLSSSLRCPSGVCGGPGSPMPLWQLVLFGRNDHGRLAKVVIDITLPADPSMVRAETAKDVPPIRLVPAR